MTRASVLHNFDVYKLVFLSVDSSKDKLGAVILQNEAPVVYESKLLNESQKNYAQIEKEMSAILFGCDRFRKYIYGQKVANAVLILPIPYMYFNFSKCKLLFLFLRKPVGKCGV